MCMDVLQSPELAAVDEAHPSNIKPTMECPSACLRTDLRLGLIALRMHVPKYTDAP